MIKKKMVGTLVLFFCSDFFIVSTTKGSDFPIMSVAGKPSADTTVTERTPLMIISFFAAADFPLASAPSSVTCFSAFSKEVSLKSGSNGFHTFSVLKGQ